MAGPSNSIPISDSYNSSFFEYLLNDNQPNIWADLSNNVPFSYSSLLSPTPIEANIPPSASMIPISTSPPRVQDSFPTVTNREESEAGPSRRPVKRCRTMAELMESTAPSQPRDPAPPSQLRDPTPPSQPRDPAPVPGKTTNPFSCGCCQVLREIIHTDGLQYQKLEVHGRIGMISHAVFHQDIQKDSYNTDSLQIFDFSKKNIEEIKNFLAWYCLNQSVQGYTLVADPLSAYYEALCVGLEWTKTQNESLGSPFPINAENRSSKGKEPEVGNNLQGDSSVPILGKRFRSRTEQSNRAASISFNDLRNLFHLPLNEAAKHVNLSVSTLKGICRRKGLKEWPFRKLQYLTRRISALKETLPSEDPILRITFQEKIGRLHQEMVQLCGGVVPDAVFIA